MIVLPHARSPRLLVPAGNPAAASRAMRRFSAALSTRDTVKRLGVSGLLRAGTDASFPDRITVTERAGSLRGYLGEVFGEPVDFSMGLGTARANRKPVLQVFDSRGRDIAFVKIGGTSETDALVTTEAAALERLAGADLPSELDVPRLLHLGKWEGSSVLAMSVLGTSFLQRPSRQFDIPVQLMRRFHASFADGERALTESPLWERLVSAQAALSSAEVRESLGEALAALHRAGSERPVSLGSWHGDWTPWNMSRRRGRIQLWDWERFETGVPLGLDRCHYGVNVVTRRDGLDHSTILDGLRLAGVVGDRGPDDRVLGATYLAVIACRYLTGAESELGAPIAARSLVFLEALRAWLGLSASVSRG